MLSEIGEILLELKVISEEQLQLALGSVIQSGASLIQALVQQAAVNPNTLAEFLSRHYHVPLATWQQLDNLPSFITRMVKTEQVLAHRVVPIMLQEGVLSLAMADPTDRVALEEISFSTGYRTAPVVVAWPLLEQAIARYYGVPPDGVPPAVAKATPEQTKSANSKSAGGKSDTVFGAAPVGESKGEFNDLFAEPDDKKPAVIELTRRKDTSVAGSIAEAILAETTDLRENEIIVLEKPKARPPSPGVTSPAKSTATQPPAAIDREVGIIPQAASPAEAPEPPLSLEQAKELLRNAKQRDEVAEILVRFSSQYLPRVLLFVVRREILSGWQGRGQGITPELVRGLMLPLNSPSIFRQVRESGGDYFGPLPSTTVNDLFLSALGRTRPARVILLPISVQHKPVALLYGDCAGAPAFDTDLSPVHLLLPFVSQALEAIIWRSKLTRP